ncbi:hypothetical protein TRFO_19339 [Tritrichomonas foetus]|uniref:Uncharacterized protein n=1 Tax=Tritrichomonas foetus TaxID=1144522 RepID=A0A1J4KN81_9EUKA|nr:hypothetical protein TRFO_19339 [Tritrichomonas foetus]|eukprot:OHT11252.1 hypothetical protein TRFO_19339 [Tritrichomonas foetus]
MKPSFSPNSGPSDSSINDSLKEQLAITKEISSQGLGNSSMLNCLQAKVKELLQYKEENISLTSQLKIAKETLQLQEAEFAFQRSEYEAEINSLKQNEQNLQKAFSNKQKEAKMQYDVNVKLDASQNSTMMMKYQKWKQKYKTLFLEHQELGQQLNEKNQNLNISHYSSSSEQDEIIKKLKSELKANRKQQKQEVETFINDINKLKSEKEELKAKLRQMKIENQNKELEIKSIIEEQEGNNNSTLNIENQISSAEEECQKLRIKIKSLTKKNHNYEKIIENIPRQQNLLQHVEIEYSNLCDIVGIEPGDIGKQWTSLIQECEKFVNSNDTINELKNQNSTLQKRITTILSEKRQNRLNNENGNNNNQGSEDYLEGMFCEVNCLRKIKEQLESRIDKYQYERRFSTHILNIYSLLVKQIDYLHESLFGDTTTKMRPLILTFIFARRFFQFKKVQADNDESALKIFRGRIKYAADAKLAEIKEKISTLSEDLFDTKQQMAQYSIQSQQFENNHDHKQFELQSTNDKLTLATGKLQYLKNRMSEMQEELATLIPPDVHNKTCEELEQYKKKNAHLNKKVLHLQQKLSKYGEIEKVFNKEIKNFEWNTSQVCVDIKEMKSQLQQQKNENDTLKTMLNEKVKEILALERLIIRLKGNNVTNNIAEMAKSSGNNGYMQNITQDTQLKVEKKIIATLDNTPTPLASLINPTFLK